VTRASAARVAEAVVCRLGARVVPVRHRPRWRVVQSARSPPRASSYPCRLR